MKKKYLDICISDGLPCSRSIKGVGIGWCIKSFKDSVRVCARFSDVSLVEKRIAKKMR